jgi:alpha-mannosidase
VVFSTLTGYFDALKAELRAGTDAPVFRGEVNFAPRGVYAANARFKFAYCKAEAGLRRAERIASAAAVVTGERPLDLHPAWEAVIFNTFHDIMPGSSTERACEEQADWLGQAPHAARQAELRAFTALGARIDTRPRPPAADMPAGVPFLAFNPHPWPFEGWAELETGLDYRPIWKYIDHPQDLPVALRAPEGDLPLQKIAVESLYATHLNIRTRVVAPLSLPPFGWKLLELAYDEAAPALTMEPPVRGGPDAIANELWEVSATPGGTGVRVSRAGQTLFGPDGLAALTIEDPWGLWGDFNDSPESLSLTTVRERWTVTRVEVTEPGPLRTCLRVRLEGGRSRLDLAFSLCAGRDALDVEARAFWDERCARLELAFAGGYTSADYEVMGGSVRRGPLGEVPGGRWVRASSPAGGFGFASDALYGFNLTPQGVLQATIARATRHTADAPAAPEEHPWRPVLDSGELRFRFLLAGAQADLPRLAAELVEPPLVMPVTAAAASAGEWARAGSLLSLAAGVTLLALKPAEDGCGWILRLQSTAAEALDPGLFWLGQPVALPALAPLAIAACRLEAGADGAWRAEPCGLLEGMD